jgi:hypothetical protein
MVEANANSGIVAKSINTGTTGILVRIILVVVQDYLKKSRRYRRFTKYETESN